MDNVTHTLVGVALGRAIPERDPAVARALVWAAILGSNIPDADLLLRPLVGGGGLGYLLHHRGYTHTLLAAPVLALACVWLGARLAGCPKPQAREARGKIYLAALLGVLLHLAADFCNDY